MKKPSNASSSSVPKVIQTEEQYVTDIKKNCSVKGCWQIPEIRDKVHGMAGDYIKVM
jgi:hypothetical protein